MPPDLVLTDACRPVRAAVGPVAWVVLEELASVGESSGSTIRSTTTVRRLGNDLGLSKDTVAAALRRLIADQFVRRVDQRNDDSGQFDGSTYVVDVAAIGLASRQPAEPDPTPSDTATSQSADRPALPTDSASTTAAPAWRKRRTQPAGQLSLLDAAPDTQ